MSSEVKKDSKIFVAGHRGMVGSAIARRLKSGGYRNIIGPTRQELDLLNQDQVRQFMQAEKPDYVFLAAARVGGIHANNQFRAEFLFQNLALQTNVIHSAYLAGVKNLMFLGSSCIYPRDALQPMREEYLLTGPLEPTNEPYAIAKISGIKLCEAYNDQYATSFLSVMPTNLYGPNDNYDLNSSHVLPALLRKAHEAKLSEQATMNVWGSGHPMREFLHVDDAADGCVFLMEQGVTSGLYNLGTGSEVSILELAGIIKSVVGFSGELVFDSTKPDGTPRKLLDVSRMAALGWNSKIPLLEGIAKTYRECPFGSNILECA